MKEGTVAMYKKEYTTLTRIYVDLLSRVKKRLIITQIIAVILGVALAACIMIVSPILAQPDMYEGITAIIEVEDDNATHNNQEETQKYRYNSIVY